MVEAQVDPMEPPRFQINRKIPRAAPSPPAPVLHSPPRRVSVKQQRDWKVPPCVSHWKNAKGIHFYMRMLFKYGYKRRLLYLNIISLWFYFLNILTMC